MNSESEQTVEKAIQAAGKTAPRIVPAMLDAEIRDVVYHQFPGTTLTVCALTLQNGFIVTGESAAASPANFDRGIGEKIAFQNAREKLWPLLGFRLKDMLHNDA